MFGETCATVFLLHEEKIKTEREKRREKEVVLKSFKETIERETDSVQW